MIGAKSPGHADLDAYLRICAVFPQETVHPLLIVFAHQAAEGAAGLATSAIQVRVENVTSREETVAPA